MVYGDVGSLIPVLPGMDDAASQTPTPARHRLACVQMNPLLVSVAPYAQYLCKLLAGRLTMSAWERHQMGDLAEHLECVARQCDLLVFAEPEQSVLERVLAIRPGCQTAVSCPTSVLVARQPRWPLERVLLVVRADGGDETAVAWAGKLTQASGAELTILAVAPALPVMYSLSRNVQVGMDVLLAPNTHSGAQLRHIAQQLAAWDVSGLLRLHQGEPDWQIRWEVEAGDYDLVIIAAERHGRFHRLVLGELVGPLLHWIERPLLVARAPVNDM
ncbi:MAG: universal stress protein [Anaerolineales bacterium]|nr:universal stress protein [Anaerolineales bacterium]